MNTRCWYIVSVCSLIYLYTSVDLVHIQQSNLLLLITEIANFNGEYVKCNKISLQLS